MIAFCLVLAALAMSQATAQDGLPSATLAAVKQATVYLDLKYKGRKVSSGAGVLVRSAGDVAYVVTNRHIAEPQTTYPIKVPVTTVAPAPQKANSRTNPPWPTVGPFGPFGPSGPFSQPGRKPGDPVPPVPPGWMAKTTYSTQTVSTRVTNADVSAVFDSGGENERVLSGEVVLTDAESDLGLVRVRGQDFPKGIDLAEPTALAKSTPAYVVGFPHGKAPSTDKRSPDVMVGKGVVSSLREGDDGEVVQMQINGSLNAGGSGGPVVDAEGRLLGILGEGVLAANGLGVAIPRNVVLRFLRARTGDVQVNGLRDGGGLRLSVSTEVIDPLGHVTAVSLYCLPADKWSDAEEPLHPLDNHPDAKKFDVKLHEGKAAVTATLNANTSPVLVQLVLESREANATFVKVARWPASAKSTAELAAADVEKAKEAKVDPPTDDPAKEDQPSKTDRGKTEKSKPKTKTSRSSRPPAIGSQAQLERAIREAQEQLERGRKNAKKNTQETSDQSDRSQPARGPSRGSSAREMAGPRLGSEFVDEAPAGGLLVGFDFGHREFGGKTMIGAVRPIFRTAQGDRFGGSHGANFAPYTTVKAKSGYAVGAVRIRAGLVINGLRVRFMRINGDQLDPSDSYWSDFIGWDEGGSVTDLGGDGTPVAGILGFTDSRYCRALGLVIKGK